MYDSNNTPLILLKSNLVLIELITKNNFKINLDGKYLITFH